MAQQPRHGRSARVSPGSVLITGASSGIGAALARAYARPDRVLWLQGRDPERLAAVAEACRAAGAETGTHLMDVTDREGMAAWVEACEAARPLDLVIANAGTSAGSGGAGESAAQTRRIFAINVDGALNTVLPAVPPMVERGTGQIAVMASLAGFVGFPGAPAYCASKATLRVWAEGMRGWLGPRGVGMSVICPGFVKTPMSDGNPYPMPFLMDADRAARIIVRGLARDRGRIAFPWPMYWAVRAVGALPRVLTDRLMPGLPQKPADET